MLGKPGLKAMLGAILVLVSLVVLEAARWGVSIKREVIGDTPVVFYTVPKASGPLVVIAHGFAGSEQMMQGYALPLARAGYRVAVFEFQGHGRNTVPMSGDVDKIEGTTQRLVDQTNAVIEALESGATPVALLGHSMATDVLVRLAEIRADIGPVVLISAFSKAITDTHPKDMLLITGAWETGLRGFALDAVRMLDPSAIEGEIVVQTDQRRSAVAAPFSEHVSILHARPARAAALSWMDGFYGRTSAQPIYPTGWAILGMLAGLVLLVSATTTKWQAASAIVPSLTPKQTALSVALPMCLAPCLAVLMNTSFLPVLVADYLMLHLLTYGILQGALLWYFGQRAGRLDLPACLGLLVGCVIFGVALDRYAANFWPTPQRLWIITVLLAGTLPFMISDAVITSKARWLTRIAIRAGFLMSLGLAIALDVERLFFLIMIAPVLVLFYAVFGTMARNISSPLSSGVALGIMLAWSIGVSFPLFQN